jgi:hypothetical protein
VSVASRSIQVRSGYVSRAGGPDLDLPATGVCDAGGPRGATPVNEVFPDQLVARSKRDSVRQIDAGGEPGGGDVRTTGSYFLDGGLAGSDRVEAQGDAQVLGEPTGQVIGRAFGAVAAEVVGVRAVAGDHAEFAVGQDPLQQRGRLGTGGQQQRRQQG